MFFWTEQNYSDPCLFCNLWRKGSIPHLARSLQPYDHEQITKTINHLSINIPTINSMCVVLEYAKKKR